MGVWGIDLDLHSNAPDFRPITGHPSAEARKRALNGIRALGVPRDRRLD